MSSWVPDASSFVTPSRCELPKLLDRVGGDSLAHQDGSKLRFVVNENLTSSTSPFGAV